MPITEAKRRATNKYRMEHYDEVKIRVPKGERDIWKQAAEERSLSLQRFIIDTVRAEIFRNK